METKEEEVCSIVMLNTLELILKEARARLKNEKTEKMKYIRAMEVRLIKLGIKDLVGAMVFDKYFKVGEEDDLPLPSN